MIAPFRWFYGDSYVRPDASAVTESEPPIATHHPKPARQPDPQRRVGTRETPERTLPRAEEDFVEDRGTSDSSESGAESVEDNSWKERGLAQEEEDTYKSHKQSSDPSGHFAFGKVIERRNDLSDISNSGVRRRFVVIYGTSEEEPTTFYAL
ncbi:hypothetical protein LTR97_008608 [Elasticomyces elasticus]|uniref:Uncharacterized protein n=1 Tax=Elasticomyces elasticus TaxID=574655 RepID=A0AAN7VQ96_9PEZI|nr:hypothetical protein LTR97_008608 [Elasticomyces elasticus]